MAARASASEVELQDLSYESLLQLDDRVQCVGLKQPQLDKLEMIPTDKEIRQFGHSNVIEFFNDVKTMADWEGGT